MKRVWLFPLIFAFSMTFAQESPRPLRVAIYHFDASNVKDNIQAELGRNIDYGKIAADLLESRLVGGKIEVINRDQIERLLKEQNLKFSDRFDPSQAPQFGKLLNVDAIVTGKIDSLYTETKQETKGFGSVIGVGKKSTKLKATVGVTAMLIATATAKTLAAPSHEAAVDRDLGSEFGGTATGKVPKVPGTGSAGGTGSALTSKSASEPYIRSALRAAVEKVAQDLLEAAPQVPVYELARASAPKPRPRAGTPADGPISEASAKTSPPAAIYQPQRLPR